MKKFFKNNAKIFVLALLTIGMGFTVFTSNTFSTTTKSTKVNSDDTKEGYNYTYSVNYDNYYDDNYDGYNYYYDDENYSYDYYYDELNDNYNNNYNYNYNYDNYGYNYNTYDYNNSNNLYNYVSTSVKAPYVKYSTSATLGLFQDFDPYGLIETNGNVTVIYNNVDNTKIGNYTVAYSVCNVQSSAVCRYITINVSVRDLNNRYQKYEEYNDDKTANVKWSNTSIKKCNVGSTRCLARNIELPTATDPYNGNELNVAIVSNNININQAGYYYITYSATTNYGVTSSVVRQVQITDNNNQYVSNTYNGNIKTKEITNYEWTNVVTSSYQCINPNQSGASAWRFVAKLNNDDHATYYYNQGGYSGILKKVTFYEVNPYQGSDIREQLGTCSRYGEMKTISRTWVGVYSGTVTNYSY